MAVTRHVVDGRDPGAEHLGGFQFGSNPYLFARDHSAGRVDYALKPFPERRRLTHPGDQPFGQMSVGIDQAGHHDAVTVANHFRVRITLRELSEWRNGGDLSVIGEGDSSIADQLRPGSHR